MPRTTMVTLRRIGGGSQNIELEEGHYTPDADNKKVVAFAVKMDDSNYKGYVLHAKHLPPPKENHLKAAIAGAGTGGTVGSLAGAPGMAAGAGIGAILGVAGRRWWQHHADNASKAVAPEEWVYIDKNNQEYFEGPIYLR